MLIVDEVATGDGLQEIEKEIEPPTSKRPRLESINTEAEVPLKGKLIMQLLITYKLLITY